MSSKFKTRFGCEVKDFHPENHFEKKEIKKYDLFSLYAMAASDQALKDANLHPADMSDEELYEIGVIWASGNGGIGTFEEQLKEFYAGDGTPDSIPISFRR